MDKTLISKRVYFDIMSSGGEKGFKSDEKVDKWSVVVFLVEVLLLIGIVGSLIGIFPVLAHT